MTYFLIVHHTFSTWIHLKQEGVWTITMLLFASSDTMAKSLRYANNHSSALQQAVLQYFFVNIAVGQWWLETKRREIKNRTVQTYCKSLKDEFGHKFKQFLKGKKNELKCGSCVSRKLKHSCIDTNTNVYVEPPCVTLAFINKPIKT